MSAFLLVAAALSTCTPTVRTPPDPGDDTGAVTVVSGTLRAPSLLRLPYVAVGAVPSEALIVAAEGPVGDFHVLIDGPFSVSGATTALADGASRTLTVTYAGSAQAPANAVGTLTLRAEGGDAIVHVGAVVGAAGLPTGLTWADDGEGLSTFARLPSAPFPKSGATWTDDRVYLWFPHGLAPGYGVITHLHGHYAVLETMIPAKALPEQVALAGRNALFIAPQGPVNAASGDFGKLMDPGGHAALVRDAVALLYREGFVDLPETGMQVVTTHSGGYRGVARILDHGGLPIDAVNLFDALYGERPTFEAFARDGGVLRSIHTPSGGTRANNEAMLATLTGDGLAIGTSALDDGASNVDVTIAPTSATHGAVMAADDVFARWLTHSGLPAH